MLETPLPCIDSSAWARTVTTWKQALMEKIIIHFCRFLYMLKINYVNKHWFYNHSKCVYVFWGHPVDCENDQLINTDFIIILSVFLSWGKDYKNDQLIAEVPLNVTGMASVFGRRACGVQNNHHTWRIRSETPPCSSLSIMPPAGRGSALNVLTAKGWGKVPETLIQNTEKTVAMEPTAGYLLLKVSAYNLSSGGFFHSLFFQGTPH